MLALACALGAAGCRTGRGHDGPDYPAAKDWVAGDAVHTQTELGNGVRVVVEENHLAPLVAIQVWVAAGAADDPPAVAGAAHMFEHLVLRGGKRRGPGGGVREIEALNGSVGAWTGLDETVYHAVVAAPYFELALDVLADAIANPNFDPAEVDRARRLALAEIAGDAADPQRRALQAVFASAFSGHGYARPVLGTDASVSALAGAALAARYAETHVGEAMTIVVVGDVDARAAAAVQRAFAAIPRGRAPETAARGEVRPMDAPVVSITGGGGSVPEIVVGFRFAPKVTARQAARLDLWGAVLARGAASRLYRELVLNRQVAEAVRPVSFRSRDGGLWAFVVTPTPHRIAQAADAALAVVFDAAAAEVTSTEIADAGAAVEADLAQAGDALPARARRLGFAAAIARDAGERRAYLEALWTTDPKELQETVKSLLEAGKPSLAVALPGGPAAGRDEAPEALRPRLEAMLRAAPGRAVERTKRRPPAVAQGDAIRFVTPAGIRVLAVRDPAAPLVAVEAAWVDRPGGGEAGPDAAAPLIAALLDRGTRTRTAGELAAEARRLGGVIDGFAAPGALGLRAAFAPSKLPGNLAPALELIADALTSPAFPDPAIEAEARALAARRRDESLTSDSRAALNLFKAELWPDVALRAEGDAVPALTRLGLLDRYRRRYPLSRLIVAIVGDVDPAQVVAGVADAFPVEAARRPAPVAVPAASAPAPAASTAAARQEPITVFRAGTGADSAAVLGYPTFAPGDPGRPAVQVLAEVLGGEGGRLAAALGDGRTTCLAGAHAAPAGAPGYLAVSLTCAPSRLDGAVASVRAALARMAAEGATPDEVSRAARRLTGARAAALRTGAAIADALIADEAQGLPLLSYRRNALALAQVAAPEVTRVARAVLDPKREVVAVVHPPSAAPALARTAGKPARPEAQR